MEQDAANERFADIVRNASDVQSAQNGPESLRNDQNSRTGNRLSPRQANAYKYCTLHPLLFPELLGTTRFQLYREAP